MKDVIEFLRSIESNEKAVKEHTDELIYAGILQQGLFPRERHFKRLFADSFLIYQPKNYVSGDFYWIGEKNGVVYFACADCTGHGVPSAMMSVLGYSLLNYALFNADLNSPSQILKKVDEKFIESFDFEKEQNMTNDWIDISLCAFDAKKGVLTFSGANRKSLLISNAKSYILPGNRFPIGGWQLEKNRFFNEISIEIKHGDWVYIGSDGYQDQFGGQNNKKFGSKKLHQLLSSLSLESGSFQKQELLHQFHSWKNGANQTDDICLMGLQF